MTARLVLASGAALAGAATGLAAVLLHQSWVWLVAALVAALAAVWALPRRGARMALALGWGIVVLRASLGRPEGDFLVASDGSGWALLAGSFAVLMVALVLGERARPT